MIELQRNVRPVHARLRNYSQVQHDFVAECVKKLVEHGMEYSNQIAQWACASHLVPMSGSDSLCFTVNLRPVDDFTLKQLLLQPNREEELTKIYDAVL